MDQPANPTQNGTLDDQPVLKQDAQALAHLASPFVGRQTELGRLQAIWENLAPGEHHLVILSGVAGVGKTRLAEEALRWTRQQNAVATTARCYPRPDRRSYEPVIDWLRSDAIRDSFAALEDGWLIELSRLVPDIRGKRPDLPAPQPIKGVRGRERLHQALARATLYGDAADAPLTLFLDDLQWCDEETVDWLAYLLGYPSTRRLLVISTLRIGQGLRSQALLSLRRRLRSSARIDELKLGPLDVAGTATLADALSGQRPESAEVSGLLFQATQGNPLFIVESIRAGLDRLLGTDARPAPNLQDLIASRLSRLSPQARDLAATAAASGRAFTLELLAATSPQDARTIVDGLDELVQAHIFQERGAGEFDFNHDKLREIVYKSLSSARRRALHRDIGAALERVHADDLASASGQIATHYERAGAWRQASRYYVQAAENEAGLFAHQQAERFYARAIDAAFELDQSGVDLLHLHVQRGRILELAGRLVEAIAVYRDLEQLARQRGDSAMACEALVLLSACLIKPGSSHNAAQAQILIERGLTLARENEMYEQETQLLWMKMTYTALYGFTKESQEAGKECIEVARRHGLERQLALALHDLGFNLQTNGQVEQGEAYAQEARALFRRHDDLALLTESLNQGALLDIQHLQFDRALRQATEAGAVTQGTNSYSLWLRGLVAVERGAWGQAQSLWAESIRVGKEVGSLMAQTAVPAMLGALQRELGRLPEALATHRSAHAASQQHAPSLIGIIEAMLAQDAFAAGDAAQGQRWLRHLTPQPVDNTSILLWLACPASAKVDGALHSGEWTDALEAVESALTEAQTRKLRLDEVRLWYERGRCLAGLGQRETAERQFRVALATAEEQGLKPLRWRLHAALCALYRSQGQQVEAAAQQAAARQLVAELSESLTDLGQRRSFQATPTVQKILAD